MKPYHMDTIYEYALSMLLRKKLSSKYGRFYQVSVAKIMQELEM